MMDVDKLANELEAVVPTADEAVGIANFSTAFTNYFYDAQLQIPPADPVWSVTDNTLEPAKAAMITAMTGLANVDGWAAIQAGITAFWGVVVTNVAIIWVSVPVLVSATPATGLSGIAAALVPVGLQNVAEAATLAEASERIAEVLHSANQGGTATDGASPKPNTWVIV